MSQYVIVDLDNCISDDRRRIPLIDWSKMDPDERYGPYHADMANDPFGNCTIVKGRSLIVITARPARYRPNTISWLRRHGLDPALIMMRGDDDHRSSVAVKRAAVMRMFDMGFTPAHIAVAYDDHPGIVQMYREMGLRAEQVSIHELDAYAPPLSVGDGIFLGKSVTLSFEMKGESDFSKLLGDSTMPVPEEGRFSFLNADAWKPPETDSTSTPELLERMAETYRERNKVYGDNFQTVGPVMRLMFPEGVPPELLGHDAFHLFELAVVKLTRLANSEFTHIDSAHDAAVYCAMIESAIRRSENV